MTNTLGMLNKKFLISGNFWYFFINSFWLQDPIKLFLQISTNHKCPCYPCQVAQCSNFGCFWQFLTFFNIFIWQKPFILHISFLRKFSLKYVLSHVLGDFLYKSWTNYNIRPNFRWIHAVLWSLWRAILVILIRKASKLSMSIYW